MPDPQWQTTDEHAPSPTDWQSTDDHSVSVGSGAQDVLDNPNNKFLYKTAEGVPVYLAGKPGSFLNETVQNPARQVVAGALDASAGANHLTANIARLMDLAAAHIADLTGTEKGGLFAHIEDWAREQQQAQQRQAANFAGNRQDLPSQLYRGGTGAVLSLPEYAVATHLGGPVAGFAGLGAINESDQGWEAALKGAAEGAALGGALEVMGPASRPLRLTGTSAMVYAQARLKGADNTTALRQALTMGALNSAQPGGVGVRDLLPRVGPLFDNPNPTEAAAYDYMREAGVAPNAGAASGSTFIKHAQKAVDTSPIGAIVAGNAQRQTTSAIRARATDLVARATPVTPADTHYEQFSRVESDPANARSVPTGAKDAEGNPETDDMPMPVPVGVLKSYLKPIYEEMQWMPAADRNSSAGYTAVKKIIEGPDYIPASQAELGLGGIKKMAREDVGRNAGLAKFIAPKLQELIDRSVNRIGGQEAMRSLQLGRTAAAQQAGADWLADTFRKAEAEGGFNREQGIWADWQRMKPAVRSTMFTPEQISELDKFFLGVKKLSENPNPSGSGVLVNTMGQLGLLMTHPIEGGPLVLTSGALSKLFHSDRGVKLLTEGLQAKPGTPQGASVAANIAGIAKGTPIVARLQDMGEAALERMRARGTFTGKLNAGVPVDDLTDMAIWGAAKIAKGTANFKTWSKEMVADAGDQIKPYLAKLYADAQKSYARHVETTEGDLPETKQLLKLYKEGEAGKDWYTKTHSELQELFGPDAELMEKFLAATSPNKTIAANVTQALKAYTQYRLGKPFEGFLPVHKEALNKIAKGEDFGGLKVQSFLANLRGEADPVTVDRWIRRAFGFKKQSITDPQYKFMDYTLTQIAKRNGMEPRQLQAAIWTAIKERDARGANTTSQPFEALLPEKIAKDPVMQSLIQRAKGGEAAPPRP